MASSINMDTDREGEFSDGGEASEEQLLSSAPTIEIRDPELADNAYPPGWTGHREVTPCSATTSMTISILLGIALAAVIVALIFTKIELNEVNAKYAVPERAKVLLEKSMLQRARELLKSHNNDGSEWLRPYGNEQSRNLIEDLNGDVWLDLYPASVIPVEGKSVVATMGDEELWKTLQEIGISVIHTNPLHRSGGLTADLKYTPSIDGWYDRIELHVDPLFGSDLDYQEASKTAAKFGGLIAGDVVPGHTGMGADWQLALMNYEDYPYLYHMVSIPEKDWPILPGVPEGQEYINIDNATQIILARLGYIDGAYNGADVQFRVPGVKTTNWSVTKIILGIDGIQRRWVYLHIFKQGQPTLNWLHKSFAAQIMITGDLLATVGEFGSKIVRFDANSMLGSERVSINSTEAKSRYHPLAPTTSDLLAMSVRKLGAFSYEENSMNPMTLASMGFSTNFGPDMSYDFSIRSGWTDGMIAGDARLLQLCIELMRNYDVGGGKRHIHSLQNHDELQIQFNYYLYRPDQTFMFDGKPWRADDINNFVKNLTYGYAAQYGVRGRYSGISSTLATIIGRRLGYNTSNTLNASAISRVKDRALSMAAFNLFQPGLFQISAWDLLGGIQLNVSDLDEKFLSDGDLRWFNRAAYDLTGRAGSNTKGVTGLPKSQYLFGSLQSQMLDPTSYAKRLQAMLKIRRDFNFSLGDLQADQTPIEFKNRTVVLPITWTSAVPAVNRAAILIVNFGFEPVTLPLDLTKMELPDFGADLATLSSVSELWPDSPKTYGVTDGAFAITVGDLEARILLIE